MHSENSCFPLIWTKMGQNRALNLNSEPYHTPTAVCLLLQTRELQIAIPKAVLQRYAFRCKTVSFRN